MHKGNLQEWSKSKKTGGACVIGGKLGVISMPKAFGIHLNLTRTPDVGHGSRVMHPSPLSCSIWIENVYSLPLYVLTAWDLVAFAVIILEGPHS